MFTLSYNPRHNPQPFLLFQLKLYPLNINFLSLLAHFLATTTLQSSMHLFTLDTSGRKPFRVCPFVTTFNVFKIHPMKASIKLSFLCKVEQYSI